MAEGGVKLAFLIFLSLYTAFAAAVVGCFIYDMTTIRCSRYSGCSEGQGTEIAIWVLCMALIVTTVILGWLWLCCGCGFCIGIIFTIGAGLAMVFFIVMLAIIGGTMALAIGVVGMILSLAMFILGILGLVMGMG